MTKRDFEFLSRTLRFAKTKLRAQDAYAHEMIVRELAHALREVAGPKFDRGRFIDDSGVSAGFTQSGNR